MRAALIVSALLHLVILAAAIVSLPKSKGFETMPVVSLPVELVTIADDTDLTEGSPDETEVVEAPAPETVEREPEPEPVPEPQQPGATDAPAPTIATDPDAVAEGPESSAPEPAAQPEPVEETPPEPDPEPQEQEVAALEAETPPLEQPTEVAETPAPTPETVTPRRRPKPPPKQTKTARVEKPVEETFDADRLSSLINRTNPTGGGLAAAKAALGVDNGRQDAALTLDEKDALRSQMQRCWRPPAGMREGQDIIVTVQVELGLDGSVLGIQSMGAQGVTGQLYDVAADAARRAVLSCQPYKLPAQKYEVWKEVQVTFDPRELF